MFTWTVDVGWTNQRPVVPEQFMSRIVVQEPDENRAILTACYWVMNRPKSILWGPSCEMVTSAKIVEVIL